MGKGGNARGAPDIISRIIQDGNLKDANAKDLSPFIDKTQNASPSDKRWYNKGGIEGVSEIGMGLNVALVPILFVTKLAPDGPFLFGFSYTEVYLAALAFNIVSAFFIHKMRTLFCNICCSVYVAFLLALFTINTPLVPTCLLIAGIAAWKIAICMSVCLHRYAAHGAFKCGPMLQFVLNLLGCAANQGGPIWWASQHRRHHKQCDVPGDPHSAMLVGTERAFSFFLELSSVEEEYAPKHNDNWYLRLVDTWCFAVCTAETLAAYYFFGREGMLVSYTSSWLCQTGTLWFNIANHPPSAPGKVCKAHCERDAPVEWYPLWQLLHRLHPFLGFFAGEIGHDDHHKHSMLAKRDSTDLAYFLFILPLKTMGLVWDVKETRLV